MEVRVSLTLTWTLKFATKKASGFATELVLSERFSRKPTLNLTLTLPLTLSLPIPNPNPNPNPIPNPDPDPTLYLTLILYPIPTSTSYSAPLFSLRFLCVQHEMRSRASKTPTPTSILTLYRNPIPDPNPDPNPNAPSCQSDCGWLLSICCLFVCDFCFVTQSGLGQVFQYPPNCLIQPPVEHLRL